MPGATFEPFEVVVVPFPFTEKPVTKRRPTLVVSASGFNDRHDQLILAMITSTQGDWASDVRLRDWRHAGLNVPCRVRFKLFTLPISLVARRVGVLSDVDRRAVQARLAGALAVG